MNALDFGRLTVAARLLGLAQGCLDHAVDYANRRVVGGRPIAATRWCSRRSPT